MNHQAKIIEVKQVSDGAVAVLCRCCDDPMTDSYHTMYLGKVEDPVAEVETHRVRVEDQHKAVQVKLKLLKDTFFTELKK